jgi:HD-GYP domain-containing protein (c-di-GMP phosphodiesterase class II)
MTEVAEVPKKFQVPDEWKVRCEIFKLNNQTRPDYVPLTSDFFRILLQVESLEFTCFLAVGWDLYEFMRPRDFSQDLVKEMIGACKTHPSSVRICVRKADFGRYEKLVAVFMKKKFEEATKGGSLAYQFPFKIYLELTAASQCVVRGMIDRETYLRVASAASSAVMNMCSSKDATRFLVEVVGKEASLYDHSAVTALVTASIAWNVLRLKKRESKLAVQSALIHDVERNCSYIGKPADTKAISVSTIKEVSALSGRKEAFHDLNVKVIEQYRERFDGRGVPKGLKGAEETDPVNGINRMSRIVSIGCAFSEYLIKRKDKRPLDYITITEMIQDRALRGELDPDFVSQFFDDVESGDVRKATSLEIKEDDDDDF